MIEVSLAASSTRRAITFSVTVPTGDFLGFRCAGCHKVGRTTVIPQDDQGDDTESDLCQACCYNFDALSEQIQGSWPVLTNSERESVWHLVRETQKQDAIALASRTAERTSLESVRATLVDLVTM